MSRLVMFNHVSLDGYFSGPQGELGWAYPASNDAEWQAFVEENAERGGTLILGRVTYEMMAGYWGTPLAEQQNPAMAQRMRELEKIVFSRTLSETSWQGTELVKSDLHATIEQLKASRRKGLTILGSGSLVSQLARARLIDEYQIVLHPLVLGAGRSLFGDWPAPLPLRRVATRSFQNGNLVLTLEPLAS